MKKQNLYKFFWDCGRMGNIESVFAATPEKIDKSIGRDVYFGEILGKHSEIYGPLSEDDLEILTSDQDFIEKAIRYKVIPTGHNPLNYLRDEEDDV